MATLQEAADMFAKDLTTMNFAGLMGAFTPEGMMKAMALQGQLMAQAQTSGQAVPAQPPGQMTSQPLATSYVVAVEDAEGDDHPVRMTFHSPTGTGVFRTTWREVDVPAAEGQTLKVWKVNDMAILQLTPSETPQAAAQASAQVAEATGGNPPSDASRE